MIMIFSDAVDFAEVASLQKTHGCTVKCNTFTVFRDHLHEKYATNFLNRELRRLKGQQNNHQICLKL